jgi:Flp pilus assembly protein TadD
MRSVITKDLVMQRLLRPAVLLLLLPLLAACGGATAPDISMHSGHEVDLTAQLALGRILLQTDPAHAEQVFQAALADSPRNADILNDLGIARDLQGHHIAAQTAYREALSAEPTLRSARINLGLSLALSGEGTEALTAVQPLAVGAAPTAAERADVAAINSLAGGSLAGSLPAK